MHSSHQGMECVSHHYGNGCVQGSLSEFVYLLLHACLAAFAYLPAYFPYLASLPDLISRSFLV
jgi:hypothetical protein